MYRRIAARLSLVLFALFFVSSCGGGGGAMGDSVAEFRSVMVAAQATTSRLESDVLKGNSCSTTGSTPGSYVTDFVDFSVNSTNYPNFNGTRSPVTIDSYTVTFIPANNSAPSIPTLHGYIQGTSVSPGGGTTIPVAVVPDSLKVTLVSNNSLPLCTTTTLNYYVTVTFSGLETYTGERRTFTSSLNVEIADRA